MHYAQGPRLQARAARASAPTPCRPGNTYFEGGIWQPDRDAATPTSSPTALGLNPTGRMATPEEIARGVVFLASPASSFTTGTNLVIDGALTKGVQL